MDTAKTDFNIVTGADDKDDTLNGTPKADIIRGLAGNDTLDSKGNDDSAAVLYTKDGQKPIFGIFGQDFMTGGAGDDVFKRAKADKGVSVILDYNPEEDRLEFDNKDNLKVTDTRLGAFVTWEDPRYNLLYDKGVLLLNTKKDVAEKAIKGDIPVKEIAGDDKDNDLKGTEEGRERLLGKGGNDKLAGLGKNDVLDGGAGNDMLDGGGGDDMLIGGANRGLAAVVKGADGKSSLFYSVNSDNFKGGEGKDTFVHNKGDSLDIFEDFKAGEDYFVSNVDKGSLKLMDTNKGAFAYYEDAQKYGQSIDLYRNGALFTGLKADDVKKALDAKKPSATSERDAEIAGSVEKLIGAIAGDFNAGDLSGGNGDMEKTLTNALATLA